MFGNLRRPKGHKGGGGGNGFGIPISSDSKEVEIELSDGGLLIGFWRNLVCLLFHLHPASDWCFASIRSRGSFELMSLGYFMNFMKLTMMVHLSRVSPHWSQGPKVVAYETAVLVSKEGRKRDIKHVPSLKF